MSKLMSLRQHPTVQRFARFIVVGVINTGFGYGVYAALVLFNTPPQIALAVSFFIGVIWNYFTTARFVFQVSGFGRFPAYVVCYVVAYLLNAVALETVITMGLSPLLAQALLTPVAAVMTFVLVSFAMRQKP